MDQAAVHDGSREHHSVLVDLASGTVGGCSGIFVGQPFDTIKVRMQTHSSYYKGPLDCAIQTWKHEGIQGFFKGLSSPLFGSAWTNAILFASYERSLQRLDDSPENPSLKSVALAGMAGGFSQTFAITPTELIKCRLQVQDGHQGKANRYSGPIDCVKHVYKRYGPTGLYRGFSCTFWRDVPSFGFYYYSYEWCKRKMINDFEINHHTSMLMAGGIAGVTSWIMAYPLDVLKSSIQTLSDDAKPGEHKMAFQARRLYRQGGLRIFAKGIEPTILRAFPCNAVTLYFYEKTSEFLKDYSRD